MEYIQQILFDSTRIIINISTNLTLKFDNEMMIFFQLRYLIQLIKQRVQYSQTFVRLIYLIKRINLSITPFIPYLFDIINKGYRIKN
ncbi:unnamed protein product [Paramecium sonneborni]|uniref:Uncharacterized protein n=1 Tax=Paramecium sonneborni TaxID=65129 RepID=A0A8S1NWJ8_9CILI|nr:unnamed protein product [Paramecium sonneborni]